MCPFCIGAAAWATAGVVSAGGLGALAAVVRRDRGSTAPDVHVSAHDRDDQAAQRREHERP